MRFSGLNESWLTLEGFEQLSDHRWIFFLLLLVAYVFVVFSDSLVIYIICSQRSLHRPMFVFVAAVLLNSLIGSAGVYPKLLSDLASGRRLVEVSHAACLSQAFWVYSLGASSFMLLAAMALDRYVSICSPLRYASLVGPTFMVALLLLCWLLPAGVVGGAMLLASRVRLCGSRISRVYCDAYSFVSLSCSEGAELQLLQLYGLLGTVTSVLLPMTFVLFTYSRILFICLQSSRAFSSKALRTCMPHLLVFLNYSLSAGVDLLQPRLQAGSQPYSSVLTSILMFMIPSICNPVVYGLKMKEVFRHVRRLLSCPTSK